MVGYVPISVDQIVFEFKVFNFNGKKDKNYMDKKYHSYVFIFTGCFDNVAHIHFKLPVINFNLDRQKQLVIYRHVNFLFSYDITVNALGPDFLVH